MVRAHTGSRTLLLKKNYFISFFIAYRVVVWNCSIDRQLVYRNMSKIIPKNDKETKPKANRRRRKKRRTEDFSDSSDSSDSSSLSSESENELDDQPDKIGNNKESIDADGDMAVLSDTEINIAEEEELNKDPSFGNIKNKLKTVELTSTALNKGNNKNINLNQVENIINQGNKLLENEYLSLMFENYGDDIDQIRKAPDFNERSLTILANVLKNGNNIFDEETLKAVVGK